MWSNYYLNIKWKWGGDTHEQCDCLGLVKLILKEQLGLTFNEDSPIDMDDNYNAMHRAVKYGTTVESVKDLKEFDLVFFKIKGSVRHIGLMVNKFGYFIHQIENKPSRVSSLNTDYWQNRFYCGIRLNGR